MQFFFFLLSAIGLGYFVLFKRRFDFFSLAFFSAIVYFLPGFFGFALRPATIYSVAGERMPLVENTYVVFCLVLTAILGAALVYDQLPALGLPDRKIPLTGLALASFVALALVGFGMTVVNLGETLLTPDKRQILLAVGRWRTLWVVSASLAAVLAFQLRRWWVLALAMGLLFVDLYVGFRNNLALTTISIFTVWLYSKGRGRLAVNQFRVAFGAGLAGFGFFLYKQLYQQVKAGDWGRLVERLGSRELFESSILDSEPFITQAVLNEVMANRFRLGMDGFAEAIYGALLFSPSLGSSFESAHDVFREVLFPGAPSSMASTIWGEMWSRGDWPLLVFFLGVFALGLAFWSTLLRSSDPLIQLIAVLNGSYWAFYMHRNTLLFQVTLHKRIIGLWLLGCSVGFIVAVSRRARPKLPRGQRKASLEEKPQEGGG